MPFLAITGARKASDFIPWGDCMCDLSPVEY